MAQLFIRLNHFANMGKYFYRSASALTLKLTLWLGVLVLLQGGCQHQPLQPAKVNSPPTIEQVRAVPQQVPRGRFSFLYVEAQDVDSDTLQYLWQPENGTIVGKGKIVQWIAPQETGAVTIQLTVTDGHGGKTTSEIVMNVISPDTANHPPKIVAIRADSTMIKGGNVTRLVAETRDADGDELQYFWIASAGAIVGDGATVTWKAPAEREQFRNQEISVLVTDNRGGVDSRSIVIPVQPPYPLPVIDSLSASPTHMFLGGKTTIRVIATNPTGTPLTYHWRASGGQFVETPQPTDTVVVWQAPSGPVCCAPGPYQIYVTVKNAEGGDAEAFVVVQVQLESNQ